MQFEVNWVTTAGGIALSEGQKVVIKTPGAREVLFGVYQNGFPVIIGQKAGDEIDFILKRADKSLKGPATLKVTAYAQNWTSNGWKADFKII